MAGQIEDDRFKSEVMRMLGNLVTKANEHDERFNDLDKKFDDLSSKADGVSSDVKLLTRQFNDVGSVAIKDHPRIDDLEERVGNLEAGVH